MDASSRSGGRRLDWSPDGRRVVTASLDKTARIWDATTGSALTELRGNHDIVYAAFSPDGNHIVVASDDVRGCEDNYERSARIWFSRRQEWWWGIAWLPEFWLTVVFGWCIRMEFLVDRRDTQVKAASA